MNEIRVLELLAIEDRLKSQRIKLLQPSVRSVQCWVSDWQDDVVFKLRLERHDPDGLDQCPRRPCFDTHSLFFELPDKGLEGLRAEHLKGLGLVRPDALHQAQTT